MFQLREYNDNNGDNLFTDVVDENGNKLFNFRVKEMFEPNGEKSLKVTIRYNGKFYNLTESGTFSFKQ